MLAAFSAAAWIRPGRAQRVYRIGVLINGPQRSMATRYEALRAGLRQLGYIDGRNVSLAVRWNDGPLERLPALAAELVKEKPDVLLGAPVHAATALQKNAQDIPIVLMWGAGAVKVGLAKSYGRPGRNVTGLETQTDELTSKHLELLKAVAPRVSRVAVLNTDEYLFHEEAWRAARQAAQRLKLILVDVRVRAVDDLGRLARECGKQGCDGLYVMPDPVMINWRPAIIEQAAKLRLPAVYFQPEFAQEGGLLAYSANIEDMCRRAAGYVDKILKGAAPSDLPIERASKFDLIINLRTARSIGVDVPAELLARADQVIR
jgi:putative ABC transport system substrate-binding protein